MARRKCYCGRLARKGAKRCAKHPHFRHGKTSVRVKVLSKSAWAVAQTALPGDVFAENWDRINGAQR